MGESLKLLPEGYYKRREKMFSAALRTHQDLAHIEALRESVRHVHPDASQEEIDRFSRNLLNLSEKDLLEGVVYSQRKQPTG